jgi:ferrous iron transport protein B
VHCPKPTPYRHHDFLKPKLLVQYEYPNPIIFDVHIARKFVLDNFEHLYLNIVDASTLERGLYLTTQLRELGVKVVVLLNMMDIVRKRGMNINIEALKKSMGCEIIPISLKEKLNFSVLFQTIEKYCLF